MVNYWCNYVDKEYKIDTVGYHSLEGLMTDIISEMQRAETDIIKFIITDRYSRTEPFTIENPKFKN